MSLSTATRAINSKNLRCGNRRAAPCAGRSGQADEVAGTRVCTVALELNGSTWQSQSEDRNVDHSTTFKRSACVRE
jgi:hypothetical protein